MQWKGLSNENNNELNIGPGGTPRIKIFQRKPIISLNRNTNPETSPEPETPARCLSLLVTMPISEFRWQNRTIASLGGHKKIYTFLLFGSF